jgi:trehalose 6-phosphate phosphatase
MRDELMCLARRPERAGLFLDFDGTLSEIVAIASEARPVAGAPEVLAELGHRLAVVAVVSGRSAHELLEWLGPEVEIWGVHGAQTTRAGVVELSDAVRPYEGLMRHVLEEARVEAATGDVAVEDKGVVVTLHWRSAADAQRAGVAAQDIAARLAERHELLVAPGRMTLELRPPVELSKAAVVLERARAEELESIMFVGDDSVDLPAFDALDELRAEGAYTVRVAVRSDESPPELLRRADVVVKGPEGVLALLNELHSSA